MKLSVRPLLYVIAVTVAMIALVSDQNGSAADHDQLETSMTTLRTGLESGASQEREDPFELRPFDPRIGDDWIGNAVAYGCYRAGQAPGQKGPSEAEVLEDLGIISRHWNLVRVYGADDDARRILQVIETHKLPVKVMLGIWLEPEEDSPAQRKANVDQILSGIELANLYSNIVIAVGVGNETQVFWSGHRMAPRNLIRYVRAIRNNVTVPVTTADDYNFWNKPESKEVADETDFVVTHMHPLWNGKTLENAISWMDQVYREIRSVHHDRMVVIGETGWATDYNANKTGPGEQGTLVKGEVSNAAQATYLIQLHQWVDSSQVTTFFFEAFDESWKGGGQSSGPNEIEKHWGVFHEDRAPKKSFLEYLAHQRQSQD